MGALCIHLARGFLRGRGGSRQNLHLTPKCKPLKWMQEQKWSYTDKYLDFWYLLHPLTDCDEVTIRCLMQSLLSVWYWALAQFPPPTPDIHFSRHQPLDAQRCAIYHKSMGRSYHMCIPAGSQSIGGV